MNSLISLVLPPHALASRLLCRALSLFSFVVALPLLGTRLLLLQGSYAFANNVFIVHWTMLTTGTTNHHDQPRQSS